MDEKRVRVDVHGGYDVIIGRDLLNKAGEYISEVFKKGVCAVITDTNVEKLYLDAVMSSLTRAGFAPRAYAFPAGEASKNMNTLSDILEFLASVPLSRSDFVVALGGGVTGDMAGFAAGCYMRSIPFVQIPTTFLAAVDSSVGGKTAVDLKSGKNLAGLFHQPSLVIMDIHTLQTLSEEDYACGSAESIKMGVISDPALFDIFENGDPRAKEQEIILRSVRAKAEIVRQDEREGSLRKLLNLGHTYAHAIERLSEYKISHGYAVSIGLNMAAKAAAKMGDMSPALAERIEKTLIKNHLPTQAPYGAEEMFFSARTDKKKAGARLSLIVPKALGDCEIRNIDYADFMNYLSL